MQNSTADIWGAKMPGISERVGDVIGAKLEARLEQEVLAEKLPKHVAFIMDGNRRFAWSHSLPTELGHLQGKQVLEDVMDWVLDLGIPYLTVYALSTENLTTRDDDELETSVKTLPSSLIKIFS